MLISSVLTPYRITLYTNSTSGVWQPCSSRSCTTRSGVGQHRQVGTPGKSQAPDGGSRLQSLHDAAERERNSPPPRIAESSLTQQPAFSSPPRCHIWSASTNCNCPAFNAILAACQVHTSATSRTGCSASARLNCSSCTPCGIIHSGYNNKLGRSTSVCQQDTPGCHLFASWTSDLTSRSPGSQLEPSCSR